MSERKPIGYHCYSSYEDDDNVIFFGFAETEEAAKKLADGFGTEKYEWGSLLAADPEAEMVPRHLWHCWLRSKPIFIFEDDEPYDFFDDREGRNCMLVAVYELVAMPEKQEVGK